jgi:DNA polymerase III epsilon subunit-like protein
MSATPTHSQDDAPADGPTATSSSSTDPGSDAPSAETTASPVPTRFVFVDTEATGLDHQRHELTEVAWIVRFEDGRQEERRYFTEHTVDGADDKALELTHYDERIAPQEKSPAKVWLTRFLEDAEGAVLVGAVPDFDARHLERMCRKLGREPTWDHHLLDVETLALPFIAPGPEAPRSLARTCDALGVSHDKDQAHGALYDARQAMLVFDAVWEMVAELRRTGGPLPAPVPRDDGDNNRAAPVPDDVTTEPSTRDPDADPATVADDAADPADPPTSS